MALHWIVPKDQRRQSWVFYRNGSDGLRLLPEVAELACERCRKFDELEAIQRVCGAEINSKRDLVGTDDGLVCVSQRLQDLLCDLTDNCSFYPLAGTDYSVLLPSVVLAADASGLEFKRPCSVCERFGEVVGLSFLQITDELPARQVGCPDIVFENGLGRDFWYFIDDELKRSLKSSGLSGIEFMRI